MSRVDRCNVGRRRLLALLGSGAAATIGGAASIQADAGAIRRFDVRFRRGRRSRSAEHSTDARVRRALSVRQRWNGVRVVPAARDGGFRRRRYRRPR